MSYEMSIPDCLLTIDQEMELNDTIKSTLTNNASIDILYIFIFFNKFSDSSFHPSIIAFVEEFTDSSPSNMVYIVATPVVIASER